MRKPRARIAAVSIESTQVLRVALAHARRVRRLPHLVERRAAQLLTREVLLDLLLQRRGELDPRRLEDPNLHLLGVERALRDVDAGGEALRLQHVPRHCRRRDPQVGDVHAGGRQAGDHRALDHPARVGRLAARDDARASVERRAERGREAHGDLRRSGRR